MHTAWGRACVAVPFAVEMRVWDYGTMAIAIAAMWYHCCSRAGMACCNLNVRMPEGRMLTVVWLLQIKCVSTVQCPLTVSYPCSAKPVCISSCSRVISSSCGPSCLPCLNRSWFSGGTACFSATAVRRSRRVCSYRTLHAGRREWI